MKQQWKYPVFAIVGAAGLVIFAGQGLAAGEHGPATTDEIVRLAHMSQGSGPHGQMAPGMLQGGMPHQGAPRPEMMHRRMQGEGMMGPGMKMRRGGHDFAMPIRPVVHLSVEDVRHALEHRLEWRGNKRLKVGKVKATDDDTIVAEIMTLDDSLVELLKVDRHSGSVQHAE